MTRTSYAKALDNALRPLGFQRDGDEWVRVRGDMWECVHRQSSWLGGVRVNLWMKDLKTEELYLEIFGPRGAIQMPPVTCRADDPTSPIERWWQRDEPDGPRRLAEAVVQFGLPHFDRVRTLEEQAETWFGRRTALTEKGYYALWLTRLALTLYRMGEVREACEVLRKPVPRTAPRTAVEDVARVREWLGCEGID